MKKMLFIEKFGIPFHDDDDSDSRYFKRKGFDVLFLGIQDWNDILDLETKFSLSIHTFDVLVLAIEGIKLYEKTGFPESIIHEFKRKIEIINKNRLYPLFLIGMHLSLANEYQPAQEKLFDGFFIGNETSPQLYNTLLKRILGT